MDLTLILSELIAKYPVLASVVGVVGILRLIFKPLFSFFHSYVLATPTSRDDEFLVKVEKSKFYSVIVFLLDYIGSIKLPKK